MSGIIIIIIIVESIIEVAKLLDCAYLFTGVRSVTKTGEKVMYDLENKINQAVFPGLQGGPHNNAISAIATAMRQAKSPEFVNYQKQVNMWLSWRLSIYKSSTQLKMNFIVKLSAGGISKFITRSLFFVIRIYFA